MKSKRELKNDTKKPENQFRIIRDEIILFQKSRNYEKKILNEFQNRVEIFNNILE